jgi:SAM-dependent methyltransferase
MGVYVFDDKWQIYRDRLAGLEALYDPQTVRHLTDIGVGEGWRCLEVGGGGGSVAAWMSDRVGARGSVLATDVSTRFLDAMSMPNLEVRKHDIVSDELPSEAFDLVHARQVFSLVSDPDQALKRIVGALRPGGWVLIEDLDWGTVSRSGTPFRYPAKDQRRGAKVIRGFLSYMEQLGYDPQYGGRLPGQLMAHGLIDIGAEMWSGLIWGGSRATLEPASILERLRDALVAGGLAAKDVDAELALITDPEVAQFPVPMVSAWGRRPEADAQVAGRAPKVPPRTESALDWLRSTPLLEGCSQADLSRVAALARRVDALAGEVLTAEGEPGDTFYLIATGSATVTRGGVRLASLGPGSYFGEIAILERGPRTATVTSDTPMRMFELEAADLAALLRDIPTVRERIEAVLAERKVRDQTKN